MTNSVSNRNDGKASDDGKSNGNADTSKNSQHHQQLAKEGDNVPSGVGVGVGGAGSNDNDSHDNTDTTTSPPQSVSPQETTRTSSLDSALTQAKPASPPAPSAMQTRSQAQSMIGPPEGLRGSDLGPDTGPVYAPSTARAGPDTVPTNQTESRLVDHDDRAGASADANPNNVNGDHSGDPAANGARNIPTISSSRHTQQQQQQQQQRQLAVQPPPPYDGLTEGIGVSGAGVPGPRTDPGRPQPPPAVITTVSYGDQQQPPPYASQQYQPPPPYTPASHAHPQLPYPRPQLHARQHSYGYGYDQGPGPGPGYGHAEAQGQGQAIQRPVSQPLPLSQPQPLPRRPRPLQLSGPTSASNTGPSPSSSGTGAAESAKKSEDENAAHAAGHGGAAKRKRRRRSSSPDPAEATKRQRTAGEDEHWAETPHRPHADGGAGVIDSAKQDFICLCMKEPKVPRPRNAFILYRQANHAWVAAQHPELTNPEISKLIGEMWRRETPEVKKKYQQLAEQEKIRHSKQYPGYRYQPRRGGRKGGAGTGAVPTTSAGDTGHCLKCGGKYIATPQTPSTPFTPAGAASVMTPLTARSMSSGDSLAPPYMNPQPGPPGHNPRAVEHMDAYNLYSQYHQQQYQQSPGLPPSVRRGSAAPGPGGALPVDAQGRRYTQPHLRDIEEDDKYAMSPRTTSMTLAPPPDSLKRRRYNSRGPFAIRSPPPPPPPPPQQQQLPMGYVPTTAMDRYARLSLSSGQPMSATGPGPGPWPRMQQPQQHRGSGTGHQPHQPPLQTQPQPYPQAYGHSHMQPPPRPSVSYHHPLQQQTPASTPNRANSGFDESLRLPPLQTHLPDTPPMTAGVMHAGQQPMTPQTAGMGFANGQKQQVGSARPQHQHQHQHPHQHPYQPQQPPQQQMQGQQQQQQREQTSPQMGSVGWSFLGKLDILRAICPPLRSPGQGAPSFEARGPLIVVEGDVPLMLKEVTTVIQKALSISGECAVRTWAENSAAEDGGAASSGEAAGKGPMNLIARYMARMLRWHKTSEELVRYMTTHPSRSSSAPGTSSERGDDRNQAGPSKEKEREVPRENGSTSEPQHHRDPNARLLPVAVVSDGYSLTASDKWAATLPIADAYRADDHWRWVATLWRGIVGADLTVYVKRIPAAAAAGPGEEEQGNGSSNCVEFANADHSVLVVRMVDDGQGRGGMDEKLERRLGFEIMEWVRSGGFKAGVGAGAGPDASAGVAPSAAIAVGKRPLMSIST